MSLTYNPIISMIYSRYHHLSLTVSSSVRYIHTHAHTPTAPQPLHHIHTNSHDPAGKTLCIHSVVIKPELRRQGLATSLLKDYIQKVMASTSIQRIRLLAHANLIGLYQGCGFQFIHVSPVVHGSETWFELGLGM